MAESETGKRSSQGSSDSPSSDDNAGHGKEALAELHPSLSAEDQRAMEKLDSKVIKVGDGDDEENDPFAHLPPHEREIVKKQLHVPEVTVTYVTLFRYATTVDLLIIAFSALACIIAGALLPLMTVRTLAKSRGRLS